MKNRGVNLLLAITCLFIGITIGFSIGRNANHQTVTLSVPAVSVDNTSISETVSRSSLVSSPLTTSADADTVPSEQTTPTETQLTIPEVTQPPEITQSAPVFPINVNTADHQTLMELPGIGEVLAQRIIDYRRNHGDFSALEELMNVEGIGTKRLEAILDYATVGG